MEGKMARQEGSETKGKQYNYCGACDCSCYCNADCEGDVRKCTSAKSIEKGGCRHCCQCYHTPFLKKYYENRG